MPHTHVTLLNLEQSYQSTILYLLLPKVSTTYCSLYVEQSNSPRQTKTGHPLKSSLGIDYEALTLLDDSPYVAAAESIHQVKAVVSTLHDEFRVNRNMDNDEQEGSLASCFEWCGILCDVEADTLSLRRRSNSSTGF